MQNIEINSKSGDELKVIRENDVEKVETFTYLDINVTKDGGGAAGVKKRMILVSA